jgi:hypothetical protein
MQGLVEKWLLQVETEMFAAIKHEVLKAIDDYDLTPRRDCVQKWIGQAVLCGATVAWTREVAEAILADAASRGDGTKLKVFFSTLSLKNIMMHHFICSKCQVNCCNTIFFFFCLCKYFVSLASISHVLPLHKSPDSSFQK